MLMRQLLVRFSSRDQSLKQRLSRLAYQVTQEHGTERPFTSAYLSNSATGTYHCIVCASPLFDSSSKFDSGTGWPSFSSPIAASSVSESTDHSYNMTRTEVSCSSCRAHLGHVFEDGPTGLRYCINGVALDFKDSTQ